RLPFLLRNAVAIWDGVWHSELRVLEGLNGQWATPDGAGPRGPKRGSDRDGIRHLHVDGWTRGLGTQRSRSRAPGGGGDDAAPRDRSRDGERSADVGPASAEVGSTQGRV